MPRKDLPLPNFAHLVRREHGPVRAREGHVPARLALHVPPVDGDRREDEDEAAQAEEGGASASAEAGLAGAVHVGGDGPRLGPERCAPRAVEEVVIEGVAEEGRVAVMVDVE